MSETPVIEGITIDFYDKVVVFDYTDLDQIGVVCRKVQGTTLRLRFSF